MKCVKRLTADQQRLAEENLTIVERVLRFDINVHPYGGCTVRVRIWQWQFHFAFCMELPELFIRQSHHAVLRIEEKPIRS